MGPEATSTTCTSGTLEHHGDASAALLRETHDRTRHAGNACRAERETAQRVAAVAVEAGRHEHELRRELPHDRLDQLYEVRVAKTIEERSRETQAQGQ